MGLGGKIPPYLVLLGFFILGGVLIFVPHYWGWHWDYGIISEIGVALLVAAILGFTIDRWLKAELRTDAFLAAIGHILAPEFRSEVSRIIGYKLICERHNLVVEIAPVATNIVKVTSSVERVIRNKSAYPQPIKNFVHLDEWGYANIKSEIVECFFELEGKKFLMGEPIVDAYTIQVRTEEQQLEPDQTVTLCAKWIECKNINDVVYFHFTNPTINPEVEVKNAQELDFIIGFGTPVQNVEPSHYTNRKRLVGTYFPHQNISVRWWPKAT